MIVECNFRKIPLRLAIISSSLIYLDFMHSIALLSKTFAFVD